MMVSRVVRWLLGVTIVVLLASWLPMNFASASTTHAYDYDGASTEAAVTAARPASLRPDCVSVTAAPAIHGYDDRANVARTTARDTGHRLAPQTPPDQPCEGMVVYRVYGPDSGNGEYGASWSPIDPRLIGPDDYRDRAGLPDSNPGTHLVIGQLIDATAVVEVRPALPCGPPHCADDRPGGLLEYVIPGNRVAVIDRVYQPLDPPYRSR